MPAAGQPTAEGELGQTPFAHLVVYAMERKLTGTLQLEEKSSSGEPRIHRLTFARGAPAKIKPADEFARLGRLLTDEGLIDDATLEGALSMHGLLGDALVMAGKVELSALEQVLDRQFRLRFVRMFAMDATVRYRYFEGVDELADWGAERCRIDPYELLWTGLERHAEKASSMEPSLAAMTEDQLLVVHPRAPLDRLALEGLAADVVDLLLLEPTSFQELCTLDVAPVELVRKVVYAMLLLRCFDLGRGALPVGVVERGPTTLARVQVKQSVQRLVAAAPDDVGDGEQRRRPRVVRRKNDPRTDPNPDAEPPSTDEPISSAPSTSRDLSPPSSGEVPAGSTPPGASTRESASGVEPASTSTPDTTKSPSYDGLPRVDKPPAPPAHKPIPSPKKPGTVDAAKTLGSETTLESATDAARLRKADAAKKAEAARKPTLPEPEPDSSVRAIQSAIPGTPTPELLALARTRIDAKDAAVAVVLTEAAVEREPNLVEARLLAAYARTLVPQADLKALSLELDDIVRANEASAEARYYRGCLRKRLGDDAGAKRDFDKAHELDPKHEGARLEVKGAAAPQPDAKRSGLLGRLFRR